MGSPARPTTDSLIRFLCEPEADGNKRFYKIDFFRLVRLLEGSRLDLPRVGLSRLPAQDLVRFAQKPYQNFASSTVQDLEAADGRPPRVSVAFLGMFGPCGALPVCYTEHALQRLGATRTESKAADSSNALRLKVSDFLDLQSWVRRLRRHEDPITRLLWDKLPVSMRQRIQDITPATFQVPPLREEFIREIGETLAQVDLWPAAVAMNVSVPPDIAELVQKRSSKADFFRLNRYLLGLAFKQEVTFVRRVASTVWDFESWHFADLAGVVRQCRDGADVFSRVLRDSFPLRVRRLLADFSPGQFVVEPLLSDFLGAVNELISTVDLVAAGACAEMELPSEIRDLAATKPTGVLLAQLNRSLLIRALAGKVSTRLGEVQRDQTLVRFLDLFHHRMISHFYRAWAINQKSVDLDRPNNPKADESQKFPFYFSCLTGAGLNSLPEEEGVPALSRNYYSGHLMTQPRSAAGLQSILQDYFGIQTRVEPFAGRWLSLPAENQCALGASKSTGLMGQSVIVGSRMWDCKLSFRIQMGPMGLADFTRMLPQRQIVCARCRRPLEPEDRQKDLIDKLPQNVTDTLSAEGGCPHCHYTGPEDWDTELPMNQRPSANPVKSIVCKKCRVPFGPDELQGELQNLPEERITARLAKSPGCVPCQSSRGRDWRVRNVGSFHRLKCWIKNYLGDEYFWDLQLILRKEEAPMAQLGRAGRLGQTIWPKTGAPAKDLDDLVIIPE